MKQKLVAIVGLGIELLALPIQGQPVAITNAVPWFCGFETNEAAGYTNEMILTDGVGGWYAGESNCIVQTGITCTNSPFTDSAQAGALGEDVTLSNRFDGATITSLWVQMDVRASRDDGDEDPEVDTNATVMFFINSNGYFRVNHITDRDDTNGQWVTLSKAITGSDVQSYESNTWVRLNIYQNYTSQTWALFLNYRLITNSINFINTNASGFNGFDIYNGAGATSYIDNISVTNTLPAELGADGGDWLPDLNLTTTNLTDVIFQGAQISNTFGVYKTTNYYDLVFSSAVVCAEGDWLSVDPVTGVDDGSAQTIKVSYDTSGLGAGSHYATITVRGWDPEFGFEAAGSPKVINVAVHVMNMPVLVLSTNALSNEVAEGQKASGQYFKLWNGSSAPRQKMEYAVTKDFAWIVVSPTNGFCVDNTNMVSLTYDTAALAPNWYTGTVTVAVTDPSLAATSKCVQVSMRVNSKPVLALTNAFGWTNEISIGEAWGSASFKVRNGSDPAKPMGKLKYDISDNMEWASLSSAGGTSTGEEYEVTVTFDTAGLSAGVYTGEVTVSGSDYATGGAATGSPRQLGVKLVVKGDVTLATTLRGFTNTVLEGYSTTNSFLVSNGGGEPWSAMSYTVSRTASWLAISPSSGTVTSDTNSISAVSDSMGLAPATYTDSIRVDAVSVSNGTPAAGSPWTGTAVLIVASRTPVNFELPEISGVAQVGQTLTADKGLWQNENRLTFSYQWQRASSYLGEGLEDIPGATASTYTITEDDKSSWLRVRVTAVDAEPSELSTDAYSLFQSSTRIKVVPGDFSGDGRTDLWFFDGPYGMWRISYVNGGTAEVQFGSLETEAVPGDYDGNGVIDFAVYHQASGIWYVLFMPAGTLAVCQFGWWETIPIEADYDGDGITDVAVYWPEGGIWYILRSSTWTWDYTQFGWGETQPVPADYDGDGIVDMAIYDNGTWTISSAAGDYWIVQFGGSGACPAPGDYDGDGIADIAVYWSAENRWEIVLSSTGKTQEESFGTSNGLGVPASGYYDSDNLLDPATVHVSGEFLIWCIQRSSEGYRGQSYQTDINMWRVAW